MPAPGRPRFGVPAAPSPRRGRREVRAGCPRAVDLDTLAGTAAKCRFASGRPDDRDLRRAARGRTTLPAAAGQGELAAGAPRRDLAAPEPHLTVIPRRGGRYAAAPAGPRIRSPAASESHPRPAPARQPGRPASGSRAGSVQRTRSCSAGRVAQLDAAAADGDLEPAARRCPAQSMRSWPSRPTGRQAHAARPCHAAATPSRVEVATVHIMPTGCPLPTRAILPDCASWSRVTCRADAFLDAAREPVLTGDRPGAGAGRGGDRANSSWPAESGCVRRSATGAGAARARPTATALLNAAASLELLHACALIHDDVMDGSDTRRGRPAIHRRFAELHRQGGWTGEPRRLRRQRCHPARRSVPGLGRPDVRRVRPRRREASRPGAAGSTPRCASS